MKQIVLQSNKENIARAEELIYDICDEYNVHNYIGVIEVAVMQAVTNAIEHGNEFQDTKNVVLSWGSCKGGMFFEIEDQGLGFDFDQYGDLPLGEGRGEGIFMMRTLADQVVYSKDGSKVRLEFSIEGIDKKDQKSRKDVLVNFFQTSLVDA